MVRFARVATIAVGLFSASMCSAGVYSDGLARCLVSHTSPQDKTQLVRWIFAIMALHPAVSDTSTVGDSERDKLNRGAGMLFERLLTSDCRNETKEALMYEGPIAIADELPGARPSRRSRIDERPQGRGGPRRLPKVHGRDEVARPRSAGVRPRQVGIRARRTYRSASAPAVRLADPPRRGLRCSVTRAADGLKRPNGRACARPVIAACRPRGQARIARPAIDNAYQRADGSVVVRRYVGRGREQLDREARHRF